MQIFAKRTSTFETHGLLCGHQIIILLYNIVIIFSSFPRKMF